MKRKYKFTIACLIVFAILIFSVYRSYKIAHPFNTNALSFDATSVNIGDVKGQLPIEHTFRFVNLTPKTWTIRDVKTSCSCTTAALSQSRIPPGGSGSITVKIDPAFIQNKFEKYAFLWIEQIPQPIKLTVTGILDPVISVSPMNIDFRKVQQDSNSSKTVTISNNLNQPVKITAISASSPFIRYWIQTQEIKSRTLLTVAIKNPPLGEFNETLKIQTSIHSRPPIVINIIGDSISKWRLSSPHLFFGFVNVGTEHTQTLSISSLSVNHIIRTSSDVSWAKISSSPDKQGGSQISVKLNLNHAKEGPLNANVYIQTNDPVCKTLTVPIIGIVQDPSNCHCHTQR